MASGRSSPLKQPNPNQLQSTIATDKSDQEPQNDQEELVNRIKNNLFIVADSFHLEAVLATHVPPTFQPPANPVFPDPKKNREEAFYKPFAKYLNDCLDATRKAYTVFAQKGDPVQPNAMDHLFTDKFLWVRNDIPCASRYGSPLKPDLVGCQFAAGTKADGIGAARRASWEHMVAYVEVKNSWLDMIAQSATYARQLFAEQPDRAACRFVLFNQRELRACIGECDRGGAYLTHQYDLAKPGSQRRFAFLLAGAYCSSLEAHGYSPRVRWRSSGARLTEMSVRWRGEWFAVRKVLCHRIGLWGRCTRALALKGTAPRASADLESGLAKLSMEEDVQEEEVDFEGLGAQATTLSANTTIISERPEVKHEYGKDEEEDVFPEPLLDLKEFDETKPFVLLDYWNHTTHREDDDRAIIKEIIALREKGLVVNGIAGFGRRQEGRVTVYAQGPAEDSSDADYYYNDCEDKTKKGRAAHLRETNDDVVELLLEKVRPAERKELKAAIESAYAVSSSTKVGSAKAPAPRYETLQESLEVGETLLVIAKSSNKTAAETILGALLGYRNAFRLNKGKGYIHRDISPANIIGIDASVRKGLKLADIDENGAPVKAETPATGLLIDVNLAIKRERKHWASEDHPGLTGTRIFVAAHLMKHVDARPSAVYDLESFLWSLVFAVLFHKQARLKEWDRAVWDALHPRDRTYAADSTMKAGLLSDMKDEEFIPADSVLKPLQGVIVPWAAMALKYAEKAKKISFKGYDAAEEADAIRKYIKAAEEALPKIKG